MDLLIGTWLYAKPFMITEELPVVEIVTLIHVVIWCVIWFGCRAYLKPFTLVCGSAVDCLSW